MFETAQLDTFGSGKFRVRAKHVDRESNLVDDSLSRTMSAAEQFEIFKDVMLSIAVLVMHCFFGQKLASKMLGHDVTMLQHGMLLAGNKTRDGNPNVAITFGVSPNFASLKTIKSSFFESFVFAFMRAVFLLCVEATTGFSRSSKRLLATFADESVFQIGRFAAALRGTRTRAVQRIVGVFFAVGRYKALLHVKVVAAFLAGKARENVAGSNVAFVESKSASAIQAAKTTLVARVTGKRLLAVFTRHFDHHGYSTVFGDTRVPVIFGVVK